MRLIDADELRAIHSMGEDCIDCHQNVRHCQYDRNYTKMDFCGWIDDAPTVDAVPVRHGRWEEDPSGYGFWICSACGFVSEASAANVLYKFCPHCGARNIEGDDES